MASDGLPVGREVSLSKLRVDRAGLGMKLYEALERAVTVVGVAKTSYRDNDVAVPILRGKSSRPLFVTSAGMDAVDASLAVRAMSGSHRIPTLLSRVDRLSRE